MLDGLHVHPSMIQVIWAQLGSPMATKYVQAFPAKLALDSRSLPVRTSCHCTFTNLFFSSCTQHRILVCQPFGYLFNEDARAVGIMEKEEIYCFFSICSSQKNINILLSEPCGSCKGRMCMYCFYLHLVALELFLPLSLTLYRKVFQTSEHSQQVS